MSVTEQLSRTKSGSPGGRRRPPRTPKGRQVDPQAVVEVRSLLTDRSRRRDLLIEHLHLIQDQYGYLSAAHLAALAAEMKMALTEVYEVATFYAHFDVVKEGETAAAAGHRARVRFTVLRHGWRREVDEGPLEQARPRGSRRACTLHGRMRSRPGLCGWPRSDIQGDSRHGGGRGEERSRTLMPGIRAPILLSIKKLAAMRCLKLASPTSERATS